MFKRTVAVVLAVIGLFLFACSGEDGLPDPGDKSSEKAILSFQIAVPAVSGVIDQTNRTISVVVPFGTDRSSLVPLVEVSSNASVNPQSGVANNFSSPNVVYRVTAEDGTMADYLVTVTVAPADSKTLDSFGIQGGIAGGVNEGAKTAWAAVPYGVDRSSLVPVFTISGSAVSNGGVQVISASSSVNFSSPQTFTVYAGNGTSQAYTVTVTNAPASAACNLLTFALEGVFGVIDHDARTVAVTLPQGTEVDSLKPVFTASPFATVSPDADTSKDFTSPVEYTVTAQNGTTKVYTVTVTISAAANSFTETFTGFNTGSSSYVSGTWTGLVTWTFVNTRRDQVIDTDAPCLNKVYGASLSAVFPNGVGKISFDMQQMFTGTPGAVHVFANGTEVSGSPFSYSSTRSNTGLINVGLSGSVTIKISNNSTATRPAIDNFYWTEGGPSETDKPTVSIDVPASGAGITSSSTTVSGTAADPGASPSGVKEVWVQLDSGSPVKASGTTSWSTTVSGMGDGSHTVYVYAIDNAGNISTTENVGFTVTLPVDTTNPTVSISAPTSGQSITGTGVTVSGTAADPGTDPSGVKEVWVKLDTTGWFKASGTTSWSYTFTSPADGSRTLSVYAVDNKGNNSTTATRGFTFTYQASAYPYIVGGVFQPQSGDPYYSYYSSAAGLSGSALRTALKSIITAGHSVSSYDALWTAYSTSDRIPSGPNTGKIWDMYSDTGTGEGGPYYYTYSSDQCGSYSGEGSCYNREHSWPKSWFNDASPMYSDLVHLVPTDGYVNGRRSNWAFGIVGSASWTSQNGSKLGSPSSQMTTWGCSESTVFEPIDPFKGDFARIYFYMCTRYWGTTEGGPMTSSNFRLLSWAQTMMKLWHENDPVSTKETSRNTAIQSHQGNRNPFVDYPGLATIIDFTL